MFSDYIGQYELRGEIGRGAMARVYRAWDTMYGREVAVKEPLFDQCMSPQSAEELSKRFVKEGGIEMNLFHPNIVTVYDAGNWGGRSAIIMELIRGKTLTNELAQQRVFQPAYALSVLDQLLDAVGYAHDKGVIHRDIKPDNIFVTQDGTVKLTDFGIAHVDSNAYTRASQDPYSNLTTVGAVLGTPGYMSPEQALGKRIDARSDLFSVAVVGYEMLTGHNPFDPQGGLEPTELLYRIAHVPAPDLPAYASAGLPVDLRPAIMAALSKNPDERPSSAAEFKAMLHREGMNDSSDFASDGIGFVAQKSGILPYVVVGAIGGILLILMLFSAQSGPAGGGGVSSSGHMSNGNDIPYTRGEVDNLADNNPIGYLYYVGISEGNVAVYSNSSSTPLEITDIDSSTLSQQSVSQLQSMVGVTSLDEAHKYIKSLQPDESGKNPGQPNQDGGKKSQEQPSTKAPSQQQSSNGEPSERGVDNGDVNSSPQFQGAHASSEFIGEPSVSHSSQNVTDGNDLTAWSEGSQGNGVGEWISLYTDGAQSVRGITIVNGNCKSKEDYEKYNRCRDISIQLSDGSVVQATLDDSFGQEQKIEFNGVHETVYIRVTIQSVYSGSMGKAASISDIAPF